MDEELLFERYNLRDHMESIAHSAHEKILSLPEDRFLSNLDAEIESIHEKSIINLPVMDFSKRQGKRRSITQFGRNGQEFQREVIGVSIPFTGDAIGFHFSASHKTLGCRGDVSKTAITITLDDNDRLESSLETAFKIIENNLISVANDLKALHHQVEAAVKSAVTTRNQKINKRKELDAKRSFPIS